MPPVNVLPQGGPPTPPRSHPRAEEAPATLQELVGGGDRVSPCGGGDRTQSWPWGLVCPYPLPI